MITLVKDKSRFYRVKRGQDCCEIEARLSVPVSGAVFAGRIIETPSTPFKVYSACVGDTYRTVALKFGVEEQALKDINGGKVVYPTCKLFVPCK